MKGLLVRVGADLSSGGGSWNGPVDCATNEFAYVAIPEGRDIHPGMERPYSDLSSALLRFGRELPRHLVGRHMHLDPDFAHLTYGDQGERAKQLSANLGAGDLLVFYAALSDARPKARLTYALIGLFVVDHLMLASDVPHEDRDCNAHSRRVLAPNAKDVVVMGRPGSSGRLERCIPIGEYRDRAYRVRKDLVEKWGGMSVHDGYLQRSARLPRLLDPGRFLHWLSKQDPKLIRVNN